MNLGPCEGDTCLVYASRTRGSILKWHWKRVSPTGERLSRSSQGYRDKGEALSVCLRCNPDLTRVTPLSNGQVSITGLVGASPRPTNRPTNA